MYQVLRTLLLHHHSDRDFIICKELISDGSLVPRPTYWTTMFQNLPVTDVVLPCTKTYTDDVAKNCPLPHLPSDWRPEDDIRIFGYFGDPSTAFSLPPSSSYGEAVIDRLVPASLCAQVPKMFVGEHDKDKWAFAHFRRGDYMQLQNTFAILSPAWYKDAATRFPEDTHMVVFCDNGQAEEIERDIRHHHVFRSWSFVDFQLPDYMQLLLMASAPRGGICANSTFSSWAAVLGLPTATYVVPRTWFSCAPHLSPSTDLRVLNHDFRGYLTRWHRLPMPAHQDVAMVTFATDAFIVHKQRHAKWADAWLPRNASLWSKSERDVDTKWLETCAQKTDVKRGYYHWAWKPWLMLQALTTTDVEYIVYCDAGSALRWCWDDILTWFHTHPERWCAAACVTYAERTHTRRDVFVHLNADTPFYTDTLQFSATAFVMRRCDASIAFCREWVAAAEAGLFVNRQDNVLTSLPHHAGFESPMHDQSVFSVLLKRWRVIPIAGHESFLGWHAFYTDFVHASAQQSAVINRLPTALTTTTTTTTRARRVAYIFTGRRLATFKHDLPPVDVYTSLSAVNMTGYDYVWMIADGVECGSNQWSKAFNSAVQKATLVPFNRLLRVSTITRVGEEEEERTDFLSTLIEPYCASTNASWYWWQNGLVNANGIPPLEARWKSFGPVTRLSRRLLETMSGSSWKAMNEMWIPTLVAHSSTLTMGELAPQSLGSHYTNCSMSRSAWQLWQPFVESGRLYGIVCSH